MSFLPKGYAPPTKREDYMKLKPGANRFRILGSFEATPPSAVMGWVGWEELDDGSRKPHRFRMAEPPLKGTFEEDAKHFLAFSVYNYTDEHDQILELTQTTIIDELYGYFGGADWGSPHDYDIEIFRIGEQKNTKYKTNPKPKMPFDPELLATVRPVNLDALFDGDDPFVFELKAEEEQKKVPF